MRQIWWHPGRALWCPQPPDRPADGSGGTTEGQRSVRQARQSPRLGAGGHTAPAVPAWQRPVAHSRACLPARMPAQPAAYPTRCCRRGRTTSALNNGSHGDRTSASGCGGGEASDCGALEGQTAMQRKLSTMRLLCLTLALLCVEQAAAGSLSPIGGTLRKRSMAEQQPVRVGAAGGVLKSAPGA